MTMELTAAILFGGLVILLAIGVEIFAAVGMMAFIGLVFFVNQPIIQFAYSAFNTMNSWVLAAIPLFIFMGAIFSDTGIVRRLFYATDTWLRMLPGGLISTVIGVNGIFGAMCGSCVAATATFGKFAYPELEAMGYNHRLALGALAAGGLLSAAIPPSLVLLVYGGWTQTSVPQLFAGVVVPGVMLMLLYMLTVVVRVKLNPALVPKPPVSTWRERLVALRDLLPWVGIIILVLGVIFGGIMTATEAASMGAFLSVILALAYRKMTFTALKSSFLTSVKITSMVAFLIFTSKVLGMVVVHIGVAEALSGLLLAAPFGKYGIIGIIALLYLIGGMFLHDWALLLLTIPIVLPVITDLGYSPLWFGVWFVLVGESGLITPPFGLNLFVLKGIVPKYDVMEIGLGALPFMIPVVIVAVLLVVFPDIALWFPELLYG